MTMTNILLSQAASPPSFSPLVLLIPLLIIVGFVSLLANPKTRWAAVVLSTFLAAMMLLGSGVFYLRSPSREVQVSYEELGPGVRIYPAAHSLERIAQAKPAVDRMVVELPPAAESGQGPKKVNSVLRILANAVLKAIEEEERGDSPPRLAEKPLVTPVADEPASPPPPDWVEHEPRLVDGVYQMSVSAGPYLTLEECESKLPEELHKAVAEYVKHLDVKARQRVQLPLDYIKEHLIQARFVERRRSSVGPMVNLHVLLGFDRQAAELIREEGRRLMVQERIRGLGVLGTLLLLALAAVYGYLKVDLTTQGRYRWRLRLAAASAIAMIAAVVVAIAAS